MNLDLSGKVAAVTGASKGIGLAVTNALAREGVCVAAGARNISEELTTLAANSQVHPVSVDLTEQGGPGRLVAEAISAYGGLDILVNNVGAVRPRLVDSSQLQTMTGAQSSRSTSSLPFAPHVPLCRRCSNAGRAPSSRSAQSTRFCPILS